MCNLTFLRKPQPQPGHLAVITVVLWCNAKHSLPSLHPSRKSSKTGSKCNHNRREMDTWSECRTAGQEWELGPVGSLDPEGPWLKCVCLGSSRNRTGCSGEQGRSCEGRGLYLSGTHPSPACELRWNQTGGRIHTLYKQTRPPVHGVLQMHNRV